MAGRCWKPASRPFFIHGVMNDPSRVRHKRSVVKQVSVDLMVVDTRFELVTPAMSMQCSTAELIDRP